MNKKAELHTIIDLAKPDIILEYESWLTPDIKNSEIFPDSFDAVGKIEQVMPMAVVYCCSVLKLQNWTPTVK